MEKSEISLKTERSRKHAAKRRKSGLEPLQIWLEADDKKMLLEYAKKNDVNVSAVVGPLVQKFLDGF